MAIPGDEGVGLVWLPQALEPREEGSASADDLEVGGREREGFDGVGVRV